MLQTEIGVRKLEAGAQARAGKRRVGLGALPRQSVYIAAKKFS